ncbi:MAG TPA: pyrroline-5-carboxylate reductase [Terriglobales bacterium]|nr:pyrroline-5-carboxylate reductase [Terriglobales bacterium]
MPETIQRQRLAILGLGKMGSILMQAFRKQNVVQAENIFATVQHAERAATLASKFGIQVTTDNRAAVADADIVLLCVKPQVLGDVVQEIASGVRENQLIISIAASVPTAYIEKRLPDGIPVIRAMPNTPSMVGAGMTAFCCGVSVKHADLEVARTLFGTVGEVVRVDEKHMDAVTGLSASGPAYIYMIMESLAEGGVKMGLPRDIATQLAAQTVLGSAKMVLETGDHPALLKDAVATPAGCTVDGILELEEGGLRVTLIKAVVKASQRAKELLFS